MLCPVHATAQFSLISFEKVSLDLRAICLAEGIYRLVVKPPNGDERWGQRSNAAIVQCSTHWAHSVRRCHSPVQYSLSAQGQALPQSSAVLTERTGSSAATVQCSTHWEHRVKRCHSPVQYSLRAQGQALPQSSAVLTERTGSSAATVQCSTHWAHRVKCCHSPVQYSLSAQ
jgi:hypothetical protein